MSDGTNIVTITATFANPQGNIPGGTWLFAATGTLMDSSYVAIVTPVVSGVLNASGELEWNNSATGVTGIGAPLLASDNYESGALMWNFFGQFAGMPVIHATNVLVNYASGASQNLFTVLAASGWTPQS